MPEEALLSELCTICHTQPPKYCCPRCSTRTCSLPCTRKHKTWSACSGKRDPAAYRTRAQLHNDSSAFDSDFNFITGVERVLERAERDAQRRGIVLEHEYMLDAAGSAAAERKKRKRGAVGVSEEEAGGRRREAGGRGKEGLVKGELAFMRAAENAGVQLVRAPRGLSRRKGNHSRVHPKHKCLSWSVEWILASTGQTLVRPCLENISLREAYDRVFPCPKDQTYSSPPAEESASNEGNERALTHRNVYFYIHRPLTTTTHIVLAPLPPDAVLRDILRGRTVVEFPTIYILPNALDKESTEDSKFLLEEIYVKDSSHKADNELRSETLDDGEDDYTSSEGSGNNETGDETGDETSDDDDDDEESQTEHQDGQGRSAS